jgi:hypothetical protein
MLQRNSESPEVRLIDIADDRKLIGDRIFVLDIADFSAATLEKKARAAVAWLKHRMPRQRAPASIEQPSVLAIAPDPLRPAIVEDISDTGNRPRRNTTKSAPTSST